MNKEYKLIAVDGELWRMVKAQAALEKKSLSEWVEAALFLKLKGNNAESRNALLDNRDA